MKKVKGAVCTYINDHNRFCHKKRANPSCYFSPRRYVCATGGGVIQTQSVFQHINVHILASGTTSSLTHIH